MSSVLAQETHGKGMGKQEQKILLPLSKTVNNSKATSDHRLLLNQEMLYHLLQLGVIK